MYATVEIGPRPGKKGFRNVKPLWRAKYGLNDVARPWVGSTCGPTFLLLACWGRWGNGKILMPEADRKGAPSQKDRYYASPDGKLSFDRS